MNRSTAMSAFGTALLLLLVIGGGVTAYLLWTTLTRNQRAIAALNGRWVLRPGSFVLTFTDGNFMSNSAQTHALPDSSMLTVPSGVVATLQRSFLGSYTLSYNGESVEPLVQGNQIVAQTSMGQIIFLRTV
jgi:hypothetical protein